MQGRACNGEAGQKSVLKDESIFYLNTIKAYTNLKNVSTPDSVVTLQQKHHNPTTVSLSMAALSWCILQVSDDSLLCLPE